MARRKTSRKSKSRKWITRKGKLGGKGFLTKPAREQHKLLDGCVKKYGYRSCLGSVMVLNRNREIKSLHGKKIDSLKNYLRKKYGGPGSFSRSRKRSSYKKSRKSTRKTGRKSSRKSKRKSSRKSKRKSSRKSKRKSK